MSRLSQRKGRNAELKDLREWESLGFDVRDRRRLEAASVSAGIDYEVWLDGERVCAIQRKHGKRPNVLAAYREVAKAVKGTPFLPVAHVQQDYGPDVAVMPWKDCQWILKELWAAYHKDA